MKAFYYIATSSGADIKVDEEAIDVLIDATEKRIVMAANGKRYTDLKNLLETREHLQEAKDWFTHYPMPEEPAE